MTEFDRNAALVMMAAWNGVPVESVIKKDAAGEIGHVTMTAWARVFEAARSLLVEKEADHG